MKNGALRELKIMGVMLGITAALEMLTHFGILEFLIRI